MKRFAIAACVVVAAVAAWTYLPAALGLTCEQCGRPMSEHSIQSRGKTYWGEEYRFYRCPDGTVWGERPH